MTRIAESEPGMWTSILMTNPDAVLERISEFQKRLTEIADAIQRQDSESYLELFLKKGVKFAKKWKSKRAGVDSFYDIYTNRSRRGRCYPDDLGITQGNFCC